MVHTVLLRLRETLIPFAVIVGVISCRKAQQQNSDNCLDFTVTDSLLADPAIGATISFLTTRDSYIFNADKQLQKHILYDFKTDTDLYVGWSDSFAYANGNMVKSYFSLGANSSSAPYTTSEYDYVGHTLTASRYYLGSILLVNTTYQVDSSGKITSLTQYADNLTYQFTPTTAYNLSYDSNGNLLQVTGPGGNLYYKFINYDDHPNPWYRLPFDYAYNVFDYNPQQFSKNNYQLEYSVLLTGDSLSNTLSYNYGSNGRISNFVLTPSNGRVSNGPGISTYETIAYKCN